MNKLEATIQFEQLVPSNATLYTNLVHVSRSGMTRKISVHVVFDGEILNITYLVAAILGYKLQDDSTVKVYGAGMDMGFHLIYQLSAELYGYDNRGAYKLSQRWI